MIKVKFCEVELGENFKCYGDIHLNYDYPIVCTCIKTKANIGKEIDGGVLFSMDDFDEVWIEEKASIKEEIERAINKHLESTKCEYCGMSDGIHRSDCSFLIGL